MISQGSVTRQQESATQRSFIWFKATSTFMNWKRISRKDFHVSIKYPSKIKCSESELISEFNSIWPVTGKTWLKFKDTKSSSSVLQRFWTHILEEYSISYPNLADLILIIVSVSPRTGPLERRFCKPAKICYKDRSCISSTVLETLYLLSTLSINAKVEALFQKAREFLQKNWLTSHWHLLNFISLVFLQFAEILS